MNNNNGQLQPTKVLIPEIHKPTTTNTATKDSQIFSLCLYGYNYL